MRISEFCKKYNCDQSAMYQKMKRYSDKINGHVCVKNGAIEIDEIAEEILKPKAKAEVYRLKQQIEEMKKQIVELEKERDLLKRQVEYFIK